MKTIGSVIRELRKEKGISQEELSIILGVTSQAVSKWENDNGLPDISLLVPIADYFDVSLDYLFLRNDAVCDAKELGYDKIKDRYTKAREKLRLYPHNYRYHLDLADAEYQLAFAELLNDGSSDRFDELTQDALLHYEAVIDNTRDDELIKRAIVGKILTLRFLERTEEADWSAKFEYPDPAVTTAEQIMMLASRGRALKEYLVKENCGN
ncbi:MAG: helix-turn-helix transcriptional regulator [Clostridia bacterium]|nr:helix-turn-helix transcriptional regulator [Clostridia bacterium]